MTKAIFFTKTQFIVVTVISLVAIVGIPIGVSIWGNDFTNHNYGTIVIHKDIDFSLRYNLPGNGTKINPYRIENLVIDNTKEYGIYIDYTTQYFLIRNCSINGVTNGIYIRNVEPGNAHIENNSINIVGQRDSNGIYVRDSQQAIIKNNYIECNNRNQDDSVFGIDIRNSHHSRIFGNNISTCTNGIHSYDISNLTITDNTIYTNFIGMYLLYANNCNISLNTIMFNQNYGIYLYGETNLIILNNFFANQLQPENIFDKQAYDRYGGNIWSDDVNRKGNYWSDLSWTETATYTIDTRIDPSVIPIDNYPLKFAY